MRRIRFPASRIVAIVTGPHPATGERSQENKKWILMDVHVDSNLELRGNLEIQDF